MKKAVGLRPDLSPPGRCRSLPAHIGKAVKPSSLSATAARFADAAITFRDAGLAPVPWAPSPPRGLPLLLPRAGETVAAGAVHRLARPHAQLACPRRPSVPDRRPANAQMPGQAGQKGKAVKRLCQLPPEASTVTDSCRFNPSQPPKGGAINARALSSLRITAGAKNPRHNITQHCVTPRVCGALRIGLRGVRESVFQLNLVPAAGYAT